MAGEISAEVSRFIVDHLKSVAQLEVLLLLRTSSDRDWSAEDVGRSLYTAPEIAGQQLSDLAARGLLAVSGSSPLMYRYGPRSSEFAALVDQLDEAYRERRVSVITLIYSKPVDKVRTFADAFRLRKEE